MNLTNQNNQIISGATSAISLNNCSNITITSARIIGGGIYLYNCSGIKIDNCYIKGANKAIDAQSSSSTIVTRCQILNVISGSQTGNAVQFNNCTGGAIVGNKIQNNPGVSSPEDVISIYQSNGTASNPILIAMNEIIGGGPSLSGGGIMLGDSGGSYQLAIGNILVNPGQYGMGISGGTNMQIINNQIFAKKATFTNVGIYIDNCSLATVSGNFVNYTNSSGQSNGYWNGTSTPAIGESTNEWNAGITASILPTTIVS